MRKGERAMIIAANEKLKPEAGKAESFEGIIDHGQKPNKCYLEDLEISSCACSMTLAKSTFIALATRRTVSSDGILLPFSM